MLHKPTALGNDESQIYTYRCLNWKPDPDATLREYWAHHEEEFHVEYSVLGMGLHTA